MYAQDQLSELCEKLSEKKEELFDRLGVSLRRSGKYYQGACPIHDGDNPTAFVVNDDGLWTCFTHECHKRYYRSMLGFIRAVLTAREGKEVPFRDIVGWAEEFLGLKLDNIKTVPKIIQPDWSIFADDEEVSYVLCIPRKDFLERLTFPAEYFIKRGWSEEVITKYDVGVCLNRAKPLYGRAVVPIYDDDREFVIGCTARSVYEKCTKCNSYHQGECTKFLAPKWQHTRECPSKKCLYNLWFSKDVIAQTGKVNICEGPGCVWKLHMAGVYNCIALCGATLSHYQQHLLEQLPIYTINVLTDNDSAGVKCRQDIKDRLGKLYNLNFPKFDSHDIGEMSVEQIHKLAL